METISTTSTFIAVIHREVKVSDRPSVWFAIRKKLEPW